MLQGLGIGRIVHYVLAEPDVPARSQGQVGKHRPAIVTDVFGELANLMVFTDGANDGQQPQGVTALGRAMAFAPIWVTSRAYNESGEPGTWHWPEKV